MAKKTILFYGDSNTHGTKPLTQMGLSERFLEHERWTGILRDLLKDQWHCIEEGLPARTTVHDDPIEGIHKNGFKYLRPCLESHLPIDVIIVMLGTNDLKTRFSVTPADIAHSVDVLLTEIKACHVGPNGDTPQLILLSPAPIVEVGFLGEIFAGGEAKSKLLAPYYAKLAQKHGALFLDVGTVVTVSPIDGVHYDAEHHHRLAFAMKDLIATL